MIHNWVKPHLDLGLGKKETPAIAMGYIDRPVTMLCYQPEALNITS